MVREVLLHSPATIVGLGVAIHFGFEGCAQVRELVVYAGQVRNENIVGVLLIRPSDTIADVRRLIVEVRHISDAPSSGPAFDARIFVRSSRLRGHSLSVV
jgi:hypothetical protein